ncbi:hypothetical protein vBVpaMR16F_176 [Vibrio phage vB_VpaM_R16F]|nr:hypothetical protein vBVpaMR16F_176 [Vibrio phage vB_VpaM_R16F]
MNNKYWGYVYSDNTFPWQEGNYLLTESEYLGCGIYITEENYPMHTPIIDVQFIIDKTDEVLGGMK